MKRSGFINFWLCSQTTNWNTAAASNKPEGRARASFKRRDSSRAFIKTAGDESIVSTNRDAVWFVSNARGNTERKRLILIEFPFKFDAIILLGVSLHEMSKSSRKFRFSEIRKLFLSLFKWNSKLGIRKSTKSMGLDEKNWLCVFRNDEIIRNFVYDSSFPLICVFFVENLVLRCIFSISYYFHILNVSLPDTFIVINTQC